ncbi:MAG: acyl-CoA reductase [Lewinella sp.]|nr:acyl-CoA reductase [Lewinella sp.]
MSLADRLAALGALGAHLRAGKDDYLAAVIKRTEFHNAWFTEANQRAALAGIAEHMLQPELLQAWVDGYAWPADQPVRTIGLVMAGNLPVVGFHDVLCVFVAGHRAKIKLSDKDPYLLPYLLKLLDDFLPGAATYFEIVDRLSDFDAVIATGSNNSLRYFKSYFGEYPHILRGNRNGVAVLTGEETPEQLLALGRDVFDFFGLGCRNVAKLYLPAGYDLDPLLEALHEYREIVLHTKYKNNFDYNYAVMVLNKVSFRANGCILLMENPSLQSSIACLHYEYYADLSQLHGELQQRAGEIQVVVGLVEMPGLPVVPFGQAQAPGLADYADGVDAVAFLLDL